VFQGEHAQCSRNQKIGEYLLNGIPHANAGAESIQVRFSYDMNGVLDIDATILSTGKIATFTVERAPGLMSERDLAEARRRLAALKFHPRDALPNVTALGRADSQYVELVGPARARLGTCIGEFRAALETQDASLIGSERDRLLRLLAELCLRLD
jgi:molecular chaperone HscC